MENTEDYDTDFYTEDDLPQQNQDFGFTPTDEFANIRTEGYSVEFGDTINKAWNFIKPNLLQLIAYTLLCFFGYLTLTFIIPQIANYMGRLGYLVGVIVNLTIVSALLAGFYSYYKKIFTKDKKVSFQNLFDGFQYIGQLALYQILVVFMIALPFIVIFFIAQQLGANQTVDIFDTNTYETFTIFYYFIFAFPSFLVFIFYVFAPLIIVVTKMNFWSAMELSRKLVLANFTGMLGFVVAFALINSVGLLFFGLGLALTLPFTFAATFILYIKLVKKNGLSTNFGGDFYTDENAPLDAF